MLEGVEWWFERDMALSQSLKKGSDVSQRTSSADETPALTKAGATSAMLERSTGSVKVMLWPGGEEKDRGEGKFEGCCVDGAHSVAVPETSAA